jgi:hypothetical protein
MKNNTTPKRMLNCSSCQKISRSILTIVWLMTDAAIHRVSNPVIWEATCLAISLSYKADLMTWCFFLLNNLNVFFYLWNDKVLWWMNIIIICIQGLHKGRYFSNFLLCRLYHPNIFNKVTDYSENGTNILS